MDQPANDEVRSGAPLDPDDSLAVTIVRRATVPFSFSRNWSFFGALHDL
jgi:hypothetical protein